jgi:hypothetical protein
VPIGEWVIRQACAEGRSLAAACACRRQSSPVQFKGANLVATVVNALSSSQLAPHRLELEITECVLLQDSETTLATLQRLRGLGVAISMDDFGTGYSSLSYLRKFRFDKIKIDQSFVHDLADNSDSLAIVRAVTRLQPGHHHHRRRRRDGGTVEPAEGRRLHPGTRIFLGRAETGKRSDPAAGWRAAASRGRIARPAAAGKVLLLNVGSKYPWWALQRLLDGARHEEVLMQGIILKDLAGQRL